VAAAARAQQSERVRRIGMLIGYAEKDAETQARLAAFRQGLEHLGWAEGRNVLLGSPTTGSLGQAERET
jgi:putative tryptophan/tyrosine transport system substrate-binding protein